MSDNTEEQITQNVLDSLAHTPDPRLKTVMSSLIRHLPLAHVAPSPTQLEPLAKMSYEPHRS